MTAQPRLVGGRYEIGDILGYGGMAEVNYGRDQRLGRNVAVKLLRQDLARDESFLIRFRREAQNSASLNHPNIVAVFDTGEDNGVPYMVMEYVPGQTLKEVLMAEGPFDPQRACNVVADMSAALDFSHKHQIIHRDVKPGNVMLSESGQIKVMDFGIARAMASGQSTMTQTSAVIGTAQYLSPEQARGETVDARSDVYATGCVLYELLVGHPPFTGDNPVSVAYQHVREEPKPPSELNPNIPPEVDAVVMKALAKNPENRYQSAGEMREDLQRAAIGAAVHAPAVMGAEERTQLLNAADADSTGPLTPIEPESSKKNGWLIFLGILLALLLTAGVAWAIWQFMDADEMGSVPDVTGLSQEDAEVELDDAGFAFEIVDEREVDDPGSDDIGTVAEQTPEGAEEATLDTTVELVVWVSPESVVLPDLTDYADFEAAETWLNDNDLEANRVEESDTAAAGTVIGQSPDAGESVEIGETVDVIVSSGDQVQVPNVVGDTEDEARGTLSGSNLGVETQTDDDCDNSDAGNVVDQSPGSGDTVGEGSTVTISICDPQDDDPTDEPVNVPNVVGEDVSDAMSILSDEGLNGVEADEETNCSNEDEVTSQSPDSGTEVEEGSDVNLTICNPDEEDSLLTR